MGESHWQFIPPLAWTKYATVLHLSFPNFQTKILLPVRPFDHYLWSKSYSTLILNKTNQAVLRKLLSHAVFHFSILLVWLVMILLLGSKGKAIGWETQLLTPF